MKKSFVQRTRYENDTFCHSEFISESTIPNVFK